MSTAAFNPAETMAPTQDDYAPFSLTSIQKLCLIDPELGLGSTPFCFGITTENRVYRFRFSVSNTHIRVMPSEKSNHGHWSPDRQPALTFQISNEDYHATTTLLMDRKSQIITQHQARQKHRADNQMQQCSEAEQNWLVERSTLHIDFDRIPSNFTPTQLNQVKAWMLHGGFVTQWETMKNESPTLTSYRLTLMEIVLNQINTDSPELAMTEFDQNAYLLRGFLSPPSIRTFTRYLPENEIATCTLHHFMIAVMHRELQSLGRTLETNNEMTSFLPMKFNSIYPSQSLALNDLKLTLNPDALSITNALKAAGEIPFNTLTNLQTKIQPIIDGDRKAWLTKSDLDMIYRYIDGDVNLLQGLHVLNNIISISLKISTFFNTTSTTLVSLIESPARLHEAFSGLNEIEQKTLITCLAKQGTLYSLLQTIKHIKTATLVLSLDNKKLIGSLLLKRQPGFRLYQSNPPRFNRLFPNLKTELIKIAQQYWENYILSIHDVIFIANTLNVRESHVFFINLPDDVKLDIIHCIIVPNDLKRLLNEIRSIKTIVQILRLLPSDQYKHLIDGSKEFIDICSSVSVKRTKQFLNRYPIENIILSLNDWASLRDKIPLEIENLLFKNMSKEHIQHLFNTCKHKFNSQPMTHDETQQELDNVDYVLSGLSNSMRLTWIIPTIVNLNNLLHNCCPKLMDLLLKHIDSKHWDNLITSPAHITYLLRDGPFPMQPSPYYQQKLRLTLPCISELKWKTVMRTREHFIFILDQSPTASLPSLAENMPRTVSNALLEINDAFIDLLGAFEPDKQQFIVQQLSIPKLQQLILLFAEQPTPFGLMYKHTIFHSLLLTPNSLPNDTIERLYQLLLRETTTLPYALQSPVLTYSNLCELKAASIMLMKQAAPCSSSASIIEPQGAHVANEYIKNAELARTLTQLKATLIHCRLCAAPLLQPNQPKNSYHVLLQNARLVQAYENKACQAELIQTTDETPPEAKRQRLN